MKKYIHLGYPKNFSTSLQRDYFSKSNDIFHLGVGLKNNLGYYDPLVDSIFEVYLKSAKTYPYERRKAELKNHIQHLYKEALSAEKKLFGASSEHISFAFTYDSLGADVKADRLLEILGSDTEIIMIIRNQIDLIKSLFRESVRVGFKGNFSDYVYYLYKYQDRNYFSDIHYSWVYNLYLNRFGRNRVHVLLFEDYRIDSCLLKGPKGKPRLFYDLDSILGIETSLHDLGHYNESLTDGELCHKIALNYKGHHDLGNHMFEVAEKHRLRNYLEYELDFHESEAITYEDVVTKRKYIEMSRTSNTDNSLQLDYSCDATLWNKLLASLNQSNIDLFKVIGRGLPESYILR